MNKVVPLFLLLALSFSTFATETYNCYDPSLCVYDIASESFDYDIERDCSFEYMKKVTSHIDYLYPSEVIIETGKDITFEHSTLPFSSIDKENGIESYSITKNGRYGTSKEWIEIHRGKNQYGLTDWKSEKHVEFFYTYFLEDADQAAFVCELK